jgi:SAM-dependent methyltransferase
MKDDPLHHKKEFDLCLVSDCIHFVEYHAALLVTIGRLLRVNGTCILCQPARGHSLRLFMSLIQALNGCNPLFEMHLHDNYDDYIYSKHLAMLNDKESHLYDPSIHYPYLLTLKKLRLFSEEIDTPAARCEAERISSAH